MSGYGPGVLDEKCLRARLSGGAVGQVRPRGVVAPAAKIVLSLGGEVVVEVIPGDRAVAFEPAVPRPPAEPRVEILPAGAIDKGCLARASRERGGIVHRRRE